MNVLYNRDVLQIFAEISMGRVDFSNLIYDIDFGLLKLGFAQLIRRLHLSVNVIQPLSRFIINLGDPDIVQFRNAIENNLSVIVDGNWSAGENRSRLE